MMISRDHIKWQSNMFRVPWVNISRSKTISLLHALIYLYNKELFLLMNAFLYKKSVLCSCHLFLFEKIKRKQNSNGEKITKR